MISKRYFKKSTVLGVIGAAALMLQLSACDGEDPIPIAEEPISFAVPDGWPQPVYNFQNNELTQDKFVLGRTLFYDMQLSINNTVSCGSCHQQFSAFAQFDHDLSHGIHDQLGKRNSPPIFNMNWHTTFFWDGRANHIETQPLNPIGDPLEMGETIGNIIAKLRVDKDYPPLFQKAYGDTSITSQRILKSLAAFMGAMVSDNSKYDQYKRGEATLTDAETRGMAVFESNCASCHKPPLFTDFSFRSNGMPVAANVYGQIDSGLAGVPPFSQANLYKFKVPSLRNLKYTKPYMHNGKVVTLNAVLDHYANIDPNAVNLDPSLTNGIQLSTSQRSDLLAFLNTLNDEKFVKDKRFAEQ